MLKKTYPELTIAELRHLPDDEGKTYLVTPEMAQTLLAMPRNDRKIRRDHVANFVRLIETGGWVMNGEPVIVHKEKLIEGQHRLTAIVETGQACPVFVTRVSDPRAMSTINTGRRRTTADVMTMQGEKWGTTVSAVCRLVNNYFKAANKLAPDYSHKIETDEALRTLEIHPRIRDHLTAANTVNHSTSLRGVVPGAMASACSYLFTEADPDLGQAFMQRWIEGLGLKAEDPEALLRKTLDQMARKRESSRAAQWRKFAIAIKAWNLRYHGNTGQVLRFSLTTTTYDDEGKRRYKTGDIFPRVAGLNHSKYEEI